ncbi:hypothetical protein GF357_05085 [Candidatus Dojkabacteria bacterium]|nr:hypothetical protein [Candidatus Dojkabacteria bacterium]
MYITVEEANTKFNRDIEFYSKWDTLSDADKERYIFSAMQLIDERSQWIGHKLSTDQENEFPRDLSTNWIRAKAEDIYYRAHRRIPIEIKKATLEMIKELFNANYTEMFNLQKSNVKSFSDGDMSVSFGNNVKSKPGAGNRKIFNLLFPFTPLGWTEMSRGQRQSPHITEADE